MLGLAFSGKTFEQPGLLAGVTTEDDLSLSALRLNLTRGGFLGTLDLGDGHRRLFGESEDAVELDDNTTRVTAQMEIDPDNFVEQAQHPRPTRKGRYEAVQGVHRTTW